MSKPLTTGEIAKYCHVTYRTVLKWIEDGKMKAYRTPGQHSRVKVEEFVRFLKHFHMPIPKEFKTVASIQRILVVDDDKTVTKALVRLLKLVGYSEIEVAHDGFDAGRKFYAFEPHLVILDMRMPGLDGFAVAQNIKMMPWGGDIKIMAISGFFDNSQKQKLINIGVDSCIDKPLVPKNFIKTIKQLFATK